MTNKSRLNKRNSRRKPKKKKQKFKKGFFLFLIFAVFVLGAGTFGYSYVKNYLDEREKQQAAQRTNVDPVKVVQLEINEGDTIATLAKKISQKFPKLKLTEADVITALNDRTRIQTLQKTYQFIPDSVLDTTIQYPLEGLFAPLTYDYYENDTIDTIIKKPLDAMNIFYQKYNSEIQKRGVSFYNALIHASITNAEVPTSDKENMKLVSQLFDNRLISGIGFGSDVTLAYALNKKELTLNDFANNSTNPYNTRINKGLIPTPVQFVTTTALEAYISPTPNDNYYFLTGTCPGREDYRQFFYAKTYDEHKINIQKHMVC